MATNGPAADLPGRRPGLPPALRASAARWRPVLSGTVNSCRSTITRWKTSLTVSRPEFGRHSDKRQVSNDGRLGPIARRSDRVRRCRDITSPRRLLVGTEDATGTC